MEIVKLIGSDVLPDDQKLVLEIARVIRLGFLQQNAFHKDDTCVSMEKQFLMMDTILYLYKQARTLVTMGHPMSVLKAENIFDRVISIKYDVPNDRLEMFAQYHRDIRRVLSECFGKECIRRTEDHVNRIFRIKQHQRPADRAGGRTGCIFRRDRGIRRRRYAEKDRPYRRNI